MRPIFLTLFATTLVSVNLLTSPIQAQPTTQTTTETTTPWLPLPARQLCNTAHAAFQSLREDKYEPAITSQVNKSMLTVWVNSKREVLVTTTISVPNANNQLTILTCIVAVGAENTWFNPDVFTEKSDTH
jgi:hypothetical protein